MKKLPQHEKQMLVDYRKNIWEVWKVYYESIKK